MSTTESKIDKAIQSLSTLKELRAQIEHELNHTHPFPNWLGVRDKFYWGPDARNTKQVLILGDNVNMAIDQMETNGQRHINYTPKPTTKKTNKPPKQPGYNI